LTARQTAPCLKHTKRHQLCTHLVDLAADSVNNPLAILVTRGLEVLDDHLDAVDNVL
jgi:hypothetical protein